MKVDKNKIRKHLLDAGRKNLQEFGYGGVNEKNILTDEIYSSFFKSMLVGNKEFTNDKNIISVIDDLLNEINKIKSHEDLLLDIFEIRNTEGKEESIQQWINKTDIKLHHFISAMDSFGKIESIEFIQWAIRNFSFDKISSDGRYYWSNRDNPKDIKYVDSTDDLYNLYLEYKYGKTA